MKTLAGFAKIVSVMLIFTTVFYLSSCNNANSDQSSSEEAVAEAEPESTTPQLNDAQIAHIVVVANQIDVNYGKIALEKATNPEARQYAETMIKDHEAIIKTASDLAQKLGVTPEDNEVSQSLLSGETETSAKLKEAAGSAFDKAYIDNEVAYHEAVINAVKTLLIPQTQNEELKQALVSVSPLLDHHLEMAKMAQSKIQ